MLRHRYGSPTAFAMTCLGKEKNKIVKIFVLSLSMGITKKGTKAIAGLCAFFFENNS